MSPELLRKLVHVTLALSFAYGATFMDLTAIVLLGIVLGVLFFLFRTKQYLKVFRRVDRTTFGELFFAAGVVVAAVLFLPYNLGAFMVGMLVLGIADPLAVLIGTRYGRHQYNIWGETRTYEGSLACAFASGGIYMLFGVSLPVACVAGGVLMLTESLSPKGSDNLTLPIIAGVLFVV